MEDAKNKFYFYLLLNFRYVNFPVSILSQREIWSQIQDIELSDIEGLYAVINPIVNHSPRFILTNVKELIVHSLNTDGMRNFVVNLILNTNHTVDNNGFSELKTLIEVNNIDNSCNTSEFIINLFNHIKNTPSLSIYFDNIFMLKRALKVF